MGHGEIDGLAVPKIKEEEKLSSTMDLYIGIFFDGTNNNKYQVMLGKIFRRKEILSKIQTLNDAPDAEALLKMPRSIVEKKYKGIFTRSELDYLYFGQEGISEDGENTYKHYSGVEEKSQKTLKGDCNNELTAAPDDENERKELGEIASTMDYEKAAKYKGSTAQIDSYTNVAILESLYKCGNEEENGKITKKHISIYIEGSGTDMQFEAATKKGHLPVIIAGLALGTGPTGVAAKVRKASILINRLLNQYKTSNDVDTIKLHFDLFGFSRGATAARVMAYVINPPQDGSSIYIPTSKYKLFTSKESEFLPHNFIKGKTLEKTIRFIGIFDTVSSIGLKDDSKAFDFISNLLENQIHKEKESHRTYLDISSLWNKIKPTILPVCKFLGNRMDKTNSVGDYVGEYIGNYLTMKFSEKIDPIVEEIKQYSQDETYKDYGTSDIDVIAEEEKRFHKDNVNDYGLWATSMAERVVHICAMDEVRKNFALVDIQSSIDSGNGVEIFLPGCHTDIGGGASIGMEKEKIINKSIDRYLTSYYVHSKSLLEKDEGALLKPINIDALKEIGWLNPDSKEAGILDKTVFTGRSNLEENETFYCDNIKPPNIILYRHVTPGYSNVALNYMKEVAIEDPFSEVPFAYKVPDDLNGLYDKLKTISIGSSGRYFVYPEQLWQYSELRRKYIHLSFNEQIKDLSDNIWVNGPEFTFIDNVKEGAIDIISRIIYPGALNAFPSEMNMFDYEDSASSFKEQSNQPIQSTLNPQVSGVDSGFQEYDSLNDSIGLLLNNA